MAEGDIRVFGEFIEQLMLGQHTLSSDEVKCALYSSGTRNLDTYTKYSTTNEITGSGYTAGGDTLSVASVTLDTGNSRVEYDNENAQWVSLASNTIVLGDVYNSGTAAANDIMCTVEIATNSNGGNYTISWNAEGIFAISYS